jgi:Arc/MetJ family transcription regulator
MRITIDIDDELLQQAILASGTTSKETAVEAALRLMIQSRFQTRLPESRGSVESGSNAPAYPLHRSRE